MIRKAPEQLLTPKRLQILLNQVELDVLDTHRQTTAFVLAKAIIQRKLRDQDALPALIHHLAELSITSPMAYIREQSRSTIHHFLKVHPDGPGSAADWLRFFLDQTDYELAHGRLSALEMVHMIFELFTDVSFFDCHLQNRKI